jgi:signal transduction histidine kinase
MSKNRPKPKTLAKPKKKRVSHSATKLCALIDDLETGDANAANVVTAVNPRDERIKRLSRRTLEVLEADRQTISKELHDSIGASLAAIKFSLEEKELMRKQNNGHLDESLDQEIAYLMGTIKETKRISANLRPATLDDLGLMATIDWYIRQFKQMYGDIEVQYTAEITEANIPEFMKIIIYRIIQEGHSNAEKHSEASTIHLDLRYDDNDGDHIFLTIEDNGRGFDVDQVFSNKDPLSGYGLTAMMERCEIVGGTFNISSAQSHGTKITAVLPI